MPQAASCVEWWNEMLEGCGSTLLKYCASRMQKTACKHCNIFTKQTNCASTNWRDLQWSLSFEVTLKIEKVHGQTQIYFLYYFSMTYDRTWKKWDFYSTALCVRFMVSRKTQSQFIFITQKAISGPDEFNLKVS